MKYLFLLLGFIFLFIGFVGIIVPGLPTTPFILLSAGLFVRSSERMYAWVIGNRYFGKHVRNYREKRAIPLYAKIISLVSMYTMISISIIFVFENNSVKILLFSLGIIGTVVLLLIPTIRE